ncbi:MAG TPA: beta-ketoacyl-ACP synthase [Gammaproteobacteria bacterium]|nr:beta-ketoacyl-ACP synthase [Gammaproteobacteria bacterium]
MKLYLNDMGVIGPLGAGKREVLSNLLAGDTGGMVPYSELLTGRATTIGRVRREPEAVPRELAELDCRNNRLLQHALDEIRVSASALGAAVGPGRVAVVLGTSTSGIASGEEAAQALARDGRMPPHFHYKQQELGTAAEFAARYLGLDGLRYTISTACSSSAKAFASAARLFAADLCDAAIVGGVDSLCLLTLNGFDALESLAAERCNPFSANRRGINIGEGACVFLVSRDESAIRLYGVGESSDGYHISAPDPSGRGAEAAIRAALADAGLAAGDVGYVNLHGTATPKNDQMESEVMARVFGLDVPCSSTKSLIGHALGAAGAQELGLCWLLLSDANGGRRLPGHVWDGVRDASLPAINLVGTDARFERDVFVSNSFAFGGSNAAIAIGRAR